MKSKPQEETSKGTDRPGTGHCREMNRQQRRETMRKIQSDDLSLEVLHPYAAGIDIGNESHYVAVFCNPIFDRPTCLVADYSFEANSL